ncbi:hypothetical protein CBER1_09507 [Cercospora berteroae]|uniref:Uncharacterized protein n=1 Tax=Cercospora berteroae TaxID=357750 RepID=A0A2S6CJ55_9PEZI|nr:hypothetical protein CBER1_09507 [Cercospora berteroae]
MLEFPSTRNSWRLDIVSILAVLGESNIKVNAHLITASPTCLLSPLMQAPQGLLAEKRMKRLPLEDDVVSCIGIDTKSERAGLKHFASIFHGTGLNRRAYNVRELAIMMHQSERVTPWIRPLWTSPTNIVAVLSCAISIGLLIWAALLRDGVAIIGITVMSGTAPVLCAGARYSLRLPKDRPHSKRGDVVYRTRDGTFTVVHCGVTVAQLLYFEPETPEYYMNLYTNRLTGGVVGGLMLVVSIALFGNSALLPERYSWDFSGFEITEEHVHENSNFTEALWVAIQNSGSVDWVIASRSVPDTPVWDQRLDEARQRLESKSQGWNANETLSRILEAQKPMMPEKGERATTETV